MNSRTIFVLALKNGWLQGQKSLDTYPKYYAYLQNLVPIRLDKDYKNKGNGWVRNAVDFSSLNVFA